MMKTAVGSTDYSAPEILKGQAYTCACDVWSLGVVAYVSLCGKPPFWGTTRNMLTKMDAGQYPMDGSQWTSISHNGKDFIRACLVADPKKRCTIEQVIHHDWLKPNVHGQMDTNVAVKALSSL